MRVRIWNILILILVGILMGTGVVAAGGAESRCHCPCQLTCRGASCDCTNHSEDCHRCYCTSVEFIGGDPHTLVPMLDNDDEPTLKAEGPSWFGHSPPSPISLAFGATEAGTGLETIYRFQCEVESLSPLIYKPDSTFNNTDYLAWKATIDENGPFWFSSAFKSDPASYEILDGDLSHLNEPLTMRYFIKDSSGNCRTCQQLWGFRKPCGLGDEGRGPDLRRGSRWRCGNAPCCGSRKPSS